MVGADRDPVKPPGSRKSGTEWFSRVHLQQIGPVGEHPAHTPRRKLRGNLPVLTVYTIIRSPAEWMAWAWAASRLSNPH
jgi:hypothetical protein